MDIIRHRCSFRMNRITPVARPLLTGLALMAVTQVQAQTSVLEEIVVTARKIQENLQDTPVAISAFTEEALERRQIFSTDDLDAVTPNLQFTAYSPLSGSNSAAQVFIRGIGQSDSSGGVDPGVGLYIDDVYMGRSVGGVMPLRDISNIQVLRGPQGTLFGRNTIGGAVLLSTRAPGQELGGNVRVTMGDDKLRELFVGVDVPMTDTIAARLSLGTRQRDGYVRRVYDGLDLGDEDTLTFNSSVHMELSERVNLVLRADYTEEDENGSPFVFAAVNENQAFPAYQSVAAGCPGATFPPPSVPTDIVDPRCANDATWYLGKYKNGGTTQAESTLENWGLSATLDFEISDTLSFKSITAYRELDWLGARDADNTALVLLSTVYESQQEQMSQEFQLLFTGERYTAVFGLFYFDEEIRDLLRVPFGPPGPPAGFHPVDYQSADLDNTNWAAFTQWTLDLTDTLSLAVGVRYTDEEKKMGLIAWGAPPVQVPVTPIPDLGTPPSSVADGLNIEPGPYTQSFSKTTGSLSLRYSVSDSTMVYGSWSEGFKSGGFNQRYNAATDDFLPTAFKSEEAETFEIGFKTDLNAYFRVNAAVFTTDYDNMQLTYRAGIVPLLFNAGKSSISGAELEFTYASDTNLIIEGSLGYLKDSIDSIALIDFSIGGDQATATLGPSDDLPFTPEYQASLSISKDFALPLGLTLTPHLNWSWTDEYYFDTANTKEVAPGAESMVNASLKLTNDQSRWSLMLGIDNLTDNQYPIAGNSALTTSSGYAEVIYSRPRNYYLTGTYNF